MNETTKLKRQKRSKSEIELERLEKEKRREEREGKKKAREDAKEKRRLEKLNPPSESELVHKYVNRVMTNQRNHGRVDTEKFDGVAHDRKENKNLWLDNDFYFSVVFQSREQKYEFLDALGWTEEEADIVEANGGTKILNGLELAESMGMPLKLETASPYPTGSLDLMPYVLDNETIESN